MALGRVKTWVDGEVLTAADLNGEFNNILNNPVTLISPSTGPINFNLQAHTNFRLESVAVAPGTAAIGRVLFNTATSAILVDNGTSILSFFPSGVAGASQVGSRVKDLDAVMTSSGLYTFQAAEYLLRSTDSSAGTSVLVISTSPKTINLGATGPAVGGKDTASVSAVNTVHFYAISTGQGSTCLGICSSNAPPTGPTMPTSYTHWCYLVSAAVQRSTTAPLSPTLVQRGADVFFNGRDAGIGLSTDGLVLSSGTSTSVAGLNPGLVIPSSDSPVVSAQTVLKLLVTNSTVANKLVAAEVFPQVLSTIAGSLPQNLSPLVLNVYAPQTSGNLDAQQVVFTLPIKPPLTTNAASTNDATNWGYVITTTATANETRGLSVNIMSYRVANGDA